MCNEWAFLAAYGRILETGSGLIHCERSALGDASPCVALGRLALHSTMENSDDRSKHLGDTV